MWSVNWIICVLAAANAQRVTVVNNEGYTVVEKQTTEQGVVETIVLSTIGVATTVVGQPAVTAPITAPTTTTIPINGFMTVINDEGYTVVEQQTTSLGVVETITLWVIQPVPWKASSKRGDAEIRSTVGLGNIVVGQPAATASITVSQTTDGFTTAPPVTQVTAAVSAGTIANYASYQSSVGDALAAGTTSVRVAFLSTGAAYGYVVNGSSRLLPSSALVLFTTLSLIAAYALGVLLS